MFKGIAVLISTLTLRAIAHTDKCVKYAPDGSCQGYGGKEIVEESAPEYSCPPGYEFNEREDCCVRYGYAPADYECPRGGYPRDGVCFRQTGFEYRCPPGFTRHGYECSKPSTTEVEATCPEGTRPAPRGCEAKVEIVPEAYCPPGEIIEADQCLGATYAEAEYVCPPGWTLRGRECFTEELYECTDLSDDIVCPAKVTGRVYAEFYKKGEKEEKGKKHHRLLKKCDGKYCTEDVCKEKPCTVSAIEKPARPPVEETVVVSQICKRTITIDADVICPQAAVYNGEKCCIPTYSPVQYKCTEFGSIEDCYRYEIIAFDYVCPEGYESWCGSGYPKKKHGNADCKCVGHEKAPADAVCPEGTYPVDERECAAEYPLEVVCPRGYVYDDEAEKCRTAEKTPVLTKYSVTYECEGKDCGKRPVPVPKPSPPVYVYNAPKVVSKGKEEEKKFKKTKHGHGSTVVYSEPVYVASSVVVESGKKHGKK